MADAATVQDTGISGFIKGLGTSIFNTASGAKNMLQDALVKINPENAAAELSKLDNPANEMFKALADKAAFKTPEGKAKLDNVRNDAGFVGALNNAIKNDPTVARGFIDIKNGAGSGAMKGVSEETFVADLQSPKDRGIFTKVLNSIADKNGPEDLKFDHLEKIAKAKKDSDYKELQKLLAKSGVQDTRVDIAADPTKLLDNFWKDPSGTVRDMMSAFGGDSLKNMPEGYRNMFLGATDLIANMVSGLTNPRGDFVGPYLQLARRVGEELGDRGDTVARRMGLNSNNGPQYDKDTYAPIRSAPAAPVEAPTAVEKRSDVGNGTTKKVAALETIFNANAPEDGLHQGYKVPAADNDTSGPKYGRVPGMQMSMTA